MRLHQVAIAALVLCGSVYAQAHGEISGTVVEAAGGRSALATVTIQSQAGGFRRDVVADRDGTYRAADLPPDSYVVTARSAGTGDSVTVSAMLRNGQSMDVPLQLIMNREPMYGGNQMDAISRGDGSFRLMRKRSRFALSCAVSDLSS